MPTATLKAPRSLLMAQKLANLLDTSFKIPFTKIRFGMDFWVGLLPFFGDFLMLLMSFKIVHYAHQLGVPTLLKIQMVKNIGIDFILGLLPVIGDIADVFYRANQKNVRLMERWWLTNNHNAISTNSQQKLQEWQDKLES